MTPDMEAMDEKGLEPCPFCGGEAILRGHQAPEFWVACNGFGCKASTEAFGSKEKAIAAWNRRALSPCLDGVVDALDEVWADATNAVCQQMQERNMCNCPDGDCLAAKVVPEPEDRAYLRAALSPYRIGEETVTDEMVEAFQAKYREIGERCNWTHSWPADEAVRELLTAALSVPAPGTGGAQP